MPWYYEILGRDKITVEQSQPVYESQWEAQWAGYRRLREKQAEDGLQIPAFGNIRVRSKD